MSEPYVRSSVIKGIFSFKHLYAVIASAGVACIGLAIADFYCHAIHFQQSVESMKADLAKYRDRGDAVERSIKANTYDQATFEEFYQSYFASISSRNLEHEAFETMMLTCEGSKRLSIAGMILFIGGVVSYYCRVQQHQAARNSN